MYPERESEREREREGEKEGEGKGEGEGEGEGEKEGGREGERERGGRERERSVLLSKLALPLLEYLREAAHVHILALRSANLGITINPITSHVNEIWLLPQCNY